MKKLLLIAMGFLLIILLSNGMGALIHKSEAESVDTELTVNNSPPSITTGPAESTASTGTNPTDEGNDVTFTATANEENGENYYLAICKTDAITGGSSGAAPTCDGGAWCVSAATSSDSQASCSHTTVDGDAESNTWYAFVCDDNTTSEACSATGDQGTGDSGSPFNVNHDPSFTAIVDDGGTGEDSGSDPGGTMTFTATASDPDTDTASDTVKLVVCGDTAGATSSGCSGTEICVSTSSAGNPSCTEPIPSVVLDGDINYYAYVFDSHDLGSGSNYLSGSYTINNVAPTVSAVTINGGSNIDLSESTTTNVVVTGTVTDNNSCQDISLLEANVYRSSITSSGCDENSEDDDNYCYAQVTCNYVGGTCLNDTDPSGDVTCTIAIEYHADPTIASTPNTDDTWLSSLYASDLSLSDSTEVAAGVEMNTLNAIEITSNPINYGNLDVGERNEVLSEDIKVSATGNIGYDIELSGTNMTDGDTGTITVGYQKYEFCPGSDYSSEGITLTSSAVENEINIPKTTTSSNPFWRNIYWGLEIPSGSPVGSYTGTNTITSVMDESANWGYEGPCLVEGLVGYWEMDETSWNGTTGEVKDSTSNNLDGTAQDDATTVAGASGFGRAGTFDGTDDHIDIPDPGTGSVLDFSDGESVSLSAWIKPSVLPANNQWITVVTKGTVDSTNDGNYMLQYGRIWTGDDCVTFCYFESDSTMHCYDGTGMTLLQNTWQHIGIRFTFGNASSIKTYHNGTGYTGTWSAGDGTGDPAITNKDLWIGADYWGGNIAEEVQGDLDEVRIYDRKLEDQDFLDLYNYTPN